MTFSQILLLTALTMVWASQSGGETLQATIRLKEKVPLEQLANHVRNPRSQRFGQPYSTEEIQHLSGLTSGEYASTLQQLQNEGFTITAQHKTHLWVSIQGDSETFSRVFGVQFATNTNGERKLSAPVQIPVYMSSLESVGGLENQRHAHPMHHLLQPKDGTTPPVFTGITPANIKTIYGFDPIYAAGINGVGQHIAIATYNDFDLTDVQSYYTQMQITPVPVVDKVQFNGAPTPDENSAMETQLDTEFSGMIAPGANIHVFSSATNDDNGELSMFTAILNDNRIKVVNYSWGNCETQVTPQHAQDMSKVFAQAVAQGVNIFVASGDSGSDGCQNGSTVADWPAEHPNVVAVGGTTLTVTPATATTAISGSEIAWSGSGGGLSKLFPMPSYQSGAGLQYPGRAFPDVAFNADPSSGQAVFAHQGGQPTWIVIGGTSMAAPQWAGFMALVGNARQSKNLPPLGFLNAKIYAAANQQVSFFNDIIAGNNGSFFAAAGYDPVTGLGSMKAQSLLNYLSNQ